MPIVDKDKLLHASTVVESSDADKGVTFLHVEHPTITGMAASPLIPYLFSRFKKDSKYLVAGNQEAQFPVSPTTVPTQRVMRVETKLLEKEIQRIQQMNRAENWMISKNQNLVLRVA